MTIQYVLNPFTSNLDAVDISTPGSLSVTTKTANYTALITDGLIQCNTNAFTVTLPAASNTGVVLRIQKIGSDTNAITIATTGGDTINGSSTTTLNTQWEQVELIADGSANWVIANRSYPESWIQYTPTFTGFGTATAIAIYYRRVGDSVQIRGSFTSGTSTATQAQVTLPSGVTSSTSINNPELAGYLVKGNADTNQNAPLIVPSVTYFGFGTQGVSSGGASLINGNGLLATGQSATLFLTVPVSGWN